MRISQILANLLSNAVKFTPEDGLIEVNVSFKQQDQKVILTFAVTDSGIGMNAEQQSRLFKSFEQAQSSTARKYGGTGLGLAISKHLVEMMDGNIWVESALGKGSTFSFTAPLRVATKAESEQLLAQSKERHNDRAEQPRFSGKRILLVEDIEINQEIIKVLLEPTELDIDVANNGLEAIGKWRASDGSYDLILMDIQMPEMDGLDATRRIRAMAELTRSATVPIIAMTANVFREDVERCREAGMNSHLGKPLELHAVEATLIKYLGDQKT
ncbi:hypothetical protein FACS1894104_3550 [Actinomycetota bacterium]|nr:hypothetical protein FACS1894104_3550 [Actinomycetota bacterium]